MLKELFSSTRRIVIKIIPHHSSAVYKVELTHRHAAFLGVCAVLFAAAMLTFQIGTVRAAGAQVRKLQATDAAQRAALATFSRQTREMMHRLSALQSNEREIRKLAGIGDAARQHQAKRRVVSVRQSQPAPSRRLTQQPHPSMWVYVREWLAGWRSGDSITFADESAAMSSLNARLSVAIAESQSLKEQAQMIAVAREAAVLARQRFLVAIPSIWPTEGYVSSGFGYRTYPDVGFHPGLDIVNDYGAPVYATAAGVVESAGWESGYGYKIVIDHGNGYETWYAHNSQLLVSAGDSVRKGEQIAEVGATGFATGPHCHYELLLWGRPIDPTPFLDGVPASVAKT